MELPSRNKTGILTQSNRDNRLNEYSNPKGKDSIKTLPNDLTFTSNNMKKERVSSDSGYNHHPSPPTVKMQLGVNCQLDYFENESEIDEAYDSIPTEEYEQAHFNYNEKFLDKKTSQSEEFMDSKYQRMSGENNQLVSKTLGMPKQERKITQQTSSLIGNPIVKSIKKYHQEENSISNLDIQNENIYIAKSFPKSSKEELSSISLLETSQTQGLKKKDNCQTTISQIEIKSKDTSQIEGYLLKKIDVGKLLSYGIELNQLFISLTEVDSDKKSTEFYSELLNQCHSFLEVINQGGSDLEQLSLLFRDEKTRKILIRSLSLDLVILTLVAQNLLKKEVFKNNQLILSSLANKQRQNCVYILAVIHQKVSFSRWQSAAATSKMQEYLQQIELIATQSLNKSFGRKQAAQISLLNQVRCNTELSVKDVKFLSKNDNEFHKKIIEFVRSANSGISIAAHFKSLLEYFSLYLTLQNHHQTSQNPLFIVTPFLATSPAPYLSPSSSSQIKYTLVLDLDETLIHYSEALHLVGNNSQICVRPYVEQFLSKMSHYYELIVFTAGLPDYANWVIDSFDSKKLLPTRLFRQHTIQVGNTFIKDLSRIGRDLSKIIIIDNLAENFQLQPDNGIFIREWTGDLSDTALQELLPLLEEIATSNQQDVRVALKLLKEQIQANIDNGCEFPLHNLKLKC